MITNLTIPHDNILLRAAPVDNRRGSGVITSTKDSTAQLSRGEVILVGPGQLHPNGSLIVPQVQAGDIVHYHPAAAYPVGVQSESFFVITWLDVKLIEPGTPGE